MTSACPESTPDQLCSPRLPPELFLEVFSHADRSTLAALCSTSLAFLELATPFLYETAHSPSVSSFRGCGSSIFIVAVLPALIISQVEPTYIMSRAGYLQTRGLPLPRCTLPTLRSIAQLTTEMPYSVLCAIAFFLLLYFDFLMGSDMALFRAGYHFLMVLVTEIYSVTLGQAVAELSPTVIVAPLSNPFLLVIFSLFCGVTIHKPDLPLCWSQWMYGLDPFTRHVSGLVSTELHRLPGRCLESEFKVSNRPTSSIRFAIAPEKCGWVTVSDAVWHDTIVVSKPDTIRVIIDVSFAERARQWLLGFIVFSSPLWIVGGIV